MKPVYLAYRLLVGLAVAFTLMALAGCKSEEARVAPPNESTAAPARLPGEDPHAHSPTATARTRK